MIEAYEGIVTLIIVVMAYVTYKGLSNSVFEEKYIFHVDAVLIRKEYYRIVTSGFLHGDWMHFAFNAVALSSFGVFAIRHFGLLAFFLIFIGSKVAGSLLALFVHRNHGDYRALGASGGVFGLLFASIVYLPTGELKFMLIPFTFPAWIFGIVLVVISIIGIKKKVGNIGHEAHLGGAIFGMILTAVYRPESLMSNWWIYALVGIPSIGFVIFIINKPEYLLVDSTSIKPFIKGGKGKKVKPQRSDAEELDFLLDKIAKKGISSLSKKERERLDELSGR